MTTFANTFVDSPVRQCVGKEKYRSKAFAKLTGRRMRGRKGAVYAYRCPHCDFFHLGGRR